MICPYNSAARCGIGSLVFAGSTYAYWGHSCPPLCGLAFISFGSVLNREIADLLGRHMFNFILNCSDGCIIYRPAIL